jgi:hypothetical protein
MPSFQVGTILWAKNRPKDHYNHLHVEPPTRRTGTPPLTNPGMTDGVKAIYDGLTARFGPGYYFTDPRSADADWSHMGGWNRRMIAGTNTWSQHAWWNALDIGPFYGVEEQQRFYDFLTGQETQGGDDMPLTDEDVAKLIDELVPVIASKVWSQLVSDSITGTPQSAAFHLANARSSAHKAATKPSGTGATATEVADEIANRLAT